MKLRPEVQAFAERMESRLQQGGEVAEDWRQISPLVLYEWAMGEVSGLHNALKYGQGAEDIANNAVDAANKLMMVADVVTLRGE